MPWVPEGGCSAFKDAGGRVARVSLILLSLAGYVGLALAVGLLVVEMVK